MSGFNLGALVSGGMKGYSFARDMQDQEAEAARKKKLGERADLTWQREEEFRNSLNPPSAAGGISAADHPSTTATTGESSLRNIVVQGITPPASQGTTQPAQPAWDDRARQLLEKERQSMLLPDGGGRFKPLFENDKKRLMAEATQGLLQPGEDGSISSKAAQSYTSQFRNAASKLGIVPTPEEIMQASKLAKTLKDEGIDEAAAAFRKGDIDEANRLGAQGNLNWKLTNPRQVKLPNGAIVWAADNIRPDGSKSTMNSYEVDKQLLERAAGLNFMLAEQKANTDAREAGVKEKVAAAAIEKGGTPTDTYTFNPDTIMGGGTRLNKMTGETWTYDKSGKVISHSPAHTVGRGQVVPTEQPTIPANHIAALKANPQLAAQFDEQYGKGASGQYLGTAPARTQQPAALGISGRW